ncbi:MAG TPA: hypothetical protein VF367_04070 [Candidatus Limnocylindria bacterium]
MADVSGPWLALALLMWTTGCSWLPNGTWFAELSIYVENRTPDLLEFSESDAGQLVRRSRLDPCSAILMTPDGRANVWDGVSFAVEAEPVIRFGAQPPGRAWLHIVVEGDEVSARLVDDVPNPELADRCP